MNVFFEFQKIVRRLQAENIEYALIGGVAMAFHAEARFTRDIDLLIPKLELTRVKEVLKREGYFQSAAAWSPNNAGMTLHRFLKVENQDEMIIDILVADDDRHAQIIRNAQEAVSEGMGSVRVAARDDMIRLKRERNSKQDQADIERLEDEKT
jgi:hypothetical protein